MKKLIAILCLLLTAGCSIQVQNIPTVPSNVTYNDYNITNNLTDSYLSNVDTAVTITQDYNIGNQAYYNIVSGFIYSKVNTTYYLVTSTLGLVSNNSTFTAFTSDYARHSIQHVASFSAYGISVFKFDSNQNYKVAQIGDSSTLKMNQFIYAIGTPISLLYKDSLLTASISGLDRITSLSYSTTEGYSIYSIQTSFAYSYGLLGSPVFNLDGKLIGMISNSIIDDEIEGTTFILPIDYYSHVINSLINTGTYVKGLLGVTGESQIQAINNHNSNYGYYINSVNSDSAASDAGIIAGTLITKINGVEVISTATIIKEMVQYRPGDVIELEIILTPGANSSTIWVTLR